MNEIIVFGASGHAKVVIDIIEKRGDLKIIGLYDDVNKKKRFLFNYPIFHKIGEIKEIATKTGIIAIGDNNARLRMFKLIKDEIPDFEFVSIVHPSVVIGKNVKIGIGTVIMAGCCINPDSRIGDHCIINTCSSIDHDNKIEEFAGIAPGVVTGGNVVVGRLSFVGLGTKIIQKVNVGSNSIIGAGSTVIHDMPKNIIAFGTPCKVIKSNDYNAKVF